MAAAANGREMRASDTDKVRSLPIFSGVEEDVFRRLLGTAYLQRFPGDTTLLMEGDPVDFLYVLLDGQVELQGTWNDKDTTLAVLRPVSTFILAAVVLDAEALMTARTIDRCEILMMSGTAIRAVMAENPAFGIAVARELSGCYRGLVRSIKSHKLRGGLERLANYLVTQRVREGNTELVRLPHEKRLLASLLGMTPENLSRAFNTLQHYGVVVEGANVRITKPRDLERLAKPDPLIDMHAPPLPELRAAADAEVWATERNRMSAA